LSGKEAMHVLLKPLGSQPANINLKGMKKPVRRLAGGGSVF